MHSDGALTRDDLRRLDPVEVDRRLPSVARCLGSEDPVAAALAENLLGRHPLFRFRRGAWAPPTGSSQVRLRFFDEAQISATGGVLCGLVASAQGDLRRRLVEAYAAFPGLANLVDGRGLGWDQCERDRFERLLWQHSLREFKRQMTIVLSYQCNKRCPYCFSDALLGRLSQPITWEDFLQALEWGRRAGVSRVPVTGGEPTLHPQFARMLAELRARKLTTCFSTNGCVPRASFDCLSADLVEAVTFHVLDDAEYGPGHGDQLEANIRCVKDKGIPLILRYVLCGKPPPARYLELAERYRPSALTFSPVFPGPLRQEMSRDVRSLFAAKDDLLALVRGAVALDIPPIVAKPIPMCMFSREEFLWLAAFAKLENVCDVSENQYTNNTLVNPDLTLYPCMALPLTGERLRPDLSWEQFSHISRAVVEPLQRIPMLEECPECQLHQMMLCQPACLGFVTACA